MSTTFSTFYDLVRLRELGPEAKDWATTDKNFEVISLLLKAFEQHVHTGSIGLQAPTVQPLLTEGTVGGSLSPGTTVGVRYSFVNAAGLETNATTEVDITLTSSAARPLTPTFNLISPEANAISGGTYMYVLTKVKGGGETQASDALPVTVPYDQTYAVIINFDTISTYTDGTTQLNIYRSAGLNSSFQLISEITDVNAASFTDANTSVDQTQQPPSVSTFDSTKMVTISWPSLPPYPAEAVTLNIYVTQQSGIWGASNLLTSISLGGSPPTSFNYLGSETLNVGYPYNSTQIPRQPGLIDSTQLASGVGGGGGAGSAAGAPPVGALLPYAGTGDPPLVAGAGEWVVADGRLINTTTYSIFTAEVGHAYNGGVDPGGGMVRIPDMRGRGSLGSTNMGSAAGTAVNDNAHVWFSVRGVHAGELVHTLTGAELPSHGHGVTDPGHAHNWIAGPPANPGGAGWGVLSGISNSGSGLPKAPYNDNFAGAMAQIAASFTGITGTQNYGGDGGHNNIQPFESHSYLVRIQ